MSKDARPLISNKELQRLADGIRDKTNRDTAYELLIRVRGTYERELATLRSEIKQQDSDWLAMLKAIAALDPTSEWADADDDALWEQFDPWQPLRELAGEWERVPDGTYVTKHGDGIISYGGDQLSISQRQKRMVIFVGTLPEGWELRRRVKKEPTP